jgi:tetratricopeptide (TPR) repeat protein
VTRLNLTSLVVCALSALSMLSACSSTDKKIEIAPRFTIEEVPAAIAASEADLAEGKVESALERMRSAKNTPGLPAAGRQAVQRVLERSAQAVIDGTEDPSHLRNLMDVNIPRPMAVAAGIRAARLLLADGERMKAFRLIKRLDAKFPQHPEKLAAGRILFQIGESLAKDDGTYWLFFSYKSNAPQVLEYMVMNHPSAPRGDEALTILASLYEDSGRWDLAIEKHQDLLLWFPASRRAIRSQADIPRLRLRALGSPEYDRFEMTLAREEFEAWLAEYTGRAELADLETQVRRNLADAVRRLADNDLDVARFYARVANPEGARYHALRAFETAKEGGDPDQVREAEALLESLPDEVAPESTLEPTPQPTLEQPAHAGGHTH